MNTEQIRQELRAGYTGGAIAVSKLYDALDLIDELRDTVGNLDTAAALATAWSLGWHCGWENGSSDGIIEGPSNPYL